MALRSTQRTLRRCMRKLIRDKKIDAVTISEICEMGEIGKRTFYRYYPDKYALFEDTYRREFFDKLNIENETGLYEIYRRIAEQMYGDKEFFTHAIACKGQNGFWEIFTNLLYPHSVKMLSTDPSIERDKEFYVKTDIEVTLHLLERWITGGWEQTPEEFVQGLRLGNAIHGKWQYQVAMGKEPDAYSLERFQNDEW